MFDNLVVFENRYNEINEKLYDPDIVSDQKLYADLMKELKNITPIVEKYKEYQKAHGRSRGKRNAGCGRFG